MIRILIADDHAIVREGLRQLFALCGDLCVAGEAVNGGQVLAHVRDGNVDLVLLDMAMPGISGVDLIKRLRLHQGGLPVLVLSMHNELQIARRALAAGANGYLTKDCGAETLTTAIRKVAGGGRYVTPTLGEKLALELEDNRGKPLHETLSDREYQVMWMIASGKTVRQIADELFLSPNTVSTHRTRILRKMNMKSNAELMHYAIAHHLVD
jgi:DNA-binding NarL/FixJ family response regulator